MLKVSELSASLEVSFGTSGVRGLVSSLTPELCYAFTLGFIQSVCQGSKRVAVGMDLRPSSPKIAQAVLLAIKHSGAEAIFCGALPTPALAFFAMQQSMPAIMVTGSHIPFDRNGIKFYRADGEISKDDERVIMAAQLELTTDLAAAIEASPLPIVDSSAISLFESRYLSLFPHDILLGKRVGVYEHSSVARDVIKRLLTSLGAEVVSLERTETFVPIDTEAVSAEDQQKGLAWAAQHQLDAIVSTDGDGDRPLIADEQGQWLRGDIVGILCAEYLGATHVAAPINCNTGLELSTANFTTLRTQIGSPYVIAGMAALLQQAPAAQVVGHEANGGFLVGSACFANGRALAALPTRDAILPILILLVGAIEKALPISQLARHLPARFTASDRITNFPTQKSQRLMAQLLESEEKRTQLCRLFSPHSEVKSMDQTDGLRMTLDNGDIVHLRASGNAPELRCYAEADNAEQAVRMVELVLGGITS